ncbi:hypothetical protein ACFLIM_05085 [Nonomuraea sp. M3C6]|uniref:Uncharacterized protein n=1 Tax=Nonomuraea marmarensis TaxID=3351344 RepID=A0ABW7A8P0_9ACTN
MMNNLAAAIKELNLPDGPAVRQVVVEPYEDSAGEDILRALVVTDSPEGETWSVAYFHGLHTGANRLAVEQGLDDYVHVRLFTASYWASRDRPEDTSAGNESMDSDQQERP